MTNSQEQEKAPLLANACLSRLRKVWMPRPVHALAAHPDSQAEAKPAEAESASSRPSRRSEGVLATISTVINDNLGLFR